MKCTHNIKLMLLSLILLASCTGDFEEINVDENLPTEADSGTLLPSSIFEPLNSHLNVQLKLTDQIMQYTVYRNQNELDAYDFASGSEIFSSYWDDAYKSMRDSDASIAYGETNELDAYVGAGKILNAFHLASLTELFIDVPYTEAVKGLDNVQPAYDQQQTIYPEVLNLLEDANTLLANDSEGFILGGDVLFEGDVSKWRKMANSLRLRYLLRLSNKGSIDAAQEINTIVSNPQEYPIIESNEEAAVYDFTGVEPNTSYFSLLTALGGLSPSERFVSELDGVDPNDDADDDPRLAYFADKPIDSTVVDGPYVGVKSGTTREVAQGTGGNAELFASQFTTKFQDNKDLLDFVFISYSEVQFILAEARFKNFISTSTVKSYYEDAVTANLAYWDMSVPDNFLTRADVEWDGTLENLLNQKWKAMFFNNTLATWGTHKRTGFPELVPGPAATSVTNGVVPTRVFYPTSEQSVNSANYEEASENIGGDIITADHWYQE